MFGEGIFIQDGEPWKRSRELLRPHFVHRQYEDLEVFRESVNELLDALPRNGGMVDLQPLFFRLTLDTTTAFLFGQSVHSLKSPALTNEFRLLDLYWLIGGKKFLQACSKVHEFADQIIEHNLSLDSDAGSEKKYHFLRSVEKSMQGDRELLRGQIVNILVAGRNTTACLLSWTFFLLVRHPRVLAKLQREVASIGDATDLNRTELRNMKYLQNVLKETLRLYPSVPVNTRTALKNTVLPMGGGPDRNSPIFIKKGTAVAFSVYTMHRRPDLYGMDAEIYRPERWDESMPLNDNPTNQKWGYLPFNGGPRVCLGMDFALTGAAYTVVRILQRYPKVKLPANEKVELTGVEKQTMTLVVSIKEGCKVHL
ncbi:cytochrome P450 alkane hydroxylase [Sclerotinia borealis F-4128]|uniref:Cytochrome P450 alkane hydroxylase n=1 Tax=Sclerotinia borealis (strain F-4128) TaxID=1432307 RepID=W9C2P3_SCLBF|nr:cytochrome P450 alkane hydroxylase [Sclerotinia borealis F-4128]